MQFWIFWRAEAASGRGHHRCLPDHVRVEILIETDGSDAQAVIIGNLLQKGQAIGMLVPILGWLQHR